MKSLFCQITCKSHLYLASHLPTSFLQIFYNCELVKGSVWDSHEGAKLARIRKLPWQLLHHSAQGREALNLHLNECQDRKLIKPDLVCGDGAENPLETLLLFKSSCSLCQGQRLINLNNKLCETVNIFGQLSF